MREYPKAIMSGGQTGADQGGLEAAAMLGIPTGGFAPKGFKTESGSASWLNELYGLIELDSDDYPPRTAKNVEYSDGTAIFGRRSRGSNLTEELCRKAGKPCLWISFDESPKILTDWLKLHKIKILNIGGNRESTNPGIFKATRDFLVKALR